MNDPSEPLSGWPWMLVRAEGEDAYAEAHPMSNNPYGIGSTRYYVWRQGWLSARVLRRSTTERNVT